MRMAGLIFVALLIVLAAISVWATAHIEKTYPPIGTRIGVDGETIHLVDLKDGQDLGKPPVVLIHGASVNLRDMNLALGDTLAATHRVIIPDRPGRGYSTRPADGWRIDVQARLIHDAAASLGVERPIIVGQSLGGAVALAYALRYPDDISGLVLLAPVSHEWPSGPTWYNRLSGWPVAGFLFRRLVIPVYAPLVAKDGVIGSFKPDIAPEGYYEDSGLPLLFRPRDFEANASDLRNLKPQIIEQSKRYGEIRTPTIIVTGESDRTVSPKIHSMHLAKEIPGARLVMLPDTGHALHHSETAKIVAAIEALSGS